MSEPLDRDRLRAWFDEALDGDLSADQQRIFDAALAQDAELRAEFEQQRHLLAHLGRVSQVDLVAGVQHKLRARSGGKFYRDRFSQRGPQSDHGLRMLVVLSACLVIVVLLWFAYDAGIIQSPR